MNTTSASTTPKRHGVTENSSREKNGDAASKLSIKGKMGEVQKEAHHKGDEQAAKHAFSAPSPKSSAGAQVVSRDALSSPKGSHSAPKRLAPMEQVDAEASIATRKYTEKEHAGKSEKADSTGKTEKAGKGGRTGKGGVSEKSVESEKHPISAHGAAHTRASTGTTTSSTTTTSSASLTSSGSVMDYARRRGSLSKSEEAIYENVPLEKTQTVGRSNSPTCSTGMQEKKRRSAKEKSPPVAHTSTRGKPVVEPPHKERRPSLTSSSEEEKEAVYENVVDGVVQHIGKPGNPLQSAHVQEKSRRANTKEKPLSSTHTVAARDKTVSPQQENSGRRSSLLQSKTEPSSYNLTLNPDLIHPYAPPPSLFIESFDDPRYKSFVPGSAGPSTVPSASKSRKTSGGSTQVTYIRSEKTHEKLPAAPASMLPSTTKSTPVSSAALTAAKASTSSSSTSRTTGTRRASADDGSSSSSRSEAVRQSKPALSKSRSSPARMAPPAPASQPVELSDDVSDELLTMTGSLDDVALQFESGGLDSTSSKDDIFNEYIPTPPHPPCKYYGEGQEARDWKDMRAYVEKTSTAYVMRQSLLKAELKQSSIIVDLYRNRIIQEAEIKEDNRWLQASPLQKTQDAFFAAIHARDTPGLERAIKRLREQVATMFHTIVHGHYESPMTDNAEFTKAMLLRLLQNVVTSSAREQPIETFRWVAQHLLAGFASEHLPPVTAGVIATYFVAGDHKRVDAILDYQWRVNKLNDPRRLNKGPVAFLDAEGGRFIEVPTEEAGGLSEKQRWMLQDQRRRESPPFRALWGRMKDVPASIMRECKPGGDKLVTVWAARTVRDLVRAARYRGQMMDRQQAANYIRLACQHDSGHTIQEILHPAIGPETGMWGTPGSFLRYPDDRRYADWPKRLRDLYAFHLPEIRRQSKEICGFIEAEATRFGAHRILGYLKHWPEILLEEDLIQIKLESALLGPVQDDIPFPPVSN